MPARRSTRNGPPRRALRSTPTTAPSAAHPHQRNPHRHSKTIGQKHSRSYQAEQDQDATPNSSGNGTGDGEPRETPPSGTRVNLTGTGALAAHRVRPTSPSSLCPRRSAGGGLRGGGAILARAREERERCAP